MRWSGPPELARTTLRIHPLGTGEGLCGKHSLVTFWFHPWLPVLLTRSSSTACEDFTAVCQLTPNLYGRKVEITKGPSGSIGGRQSTTGRRWSSDVTQRTQAYGLRQKTTHYPLAPLSIWHRSGSGEQGLERPCFRGPHRCRPRQCQSTFGRPRWVARRDRWVSVGCRLEYQGDFPKALTLDFEGLPQLQYF